MKNTSVLKEGRVSRLARSSGSDGELVTSIKTFLLSVSEYKYENVTLLSMLCHSYRPECLLVLIDVIIQ